MSPSFLLADFILSCCLIVELDPPLGVFLFDTIASLHEKNAKGYPVKKVIMNYMCFSINLFERLFLLIL